MVWEVEQKFCVDNLALVEEKLTALGVRFSTAITQIDHYFNHPVRDYCQTDEALRLRQQPDGNFITYKGAKIDSTTKTRQELELPLPPGPETIAQFTKLLLLVGFCQVGTVEKCRRSGQLEWKGEQIEVAIDEVAFIGSYLELEILAGQDKLDSAKAALQSLAETLDLANSERRSYLELMSQKSP